MPKEKEEAMFQNTEWNAHPKGYPEHMDINDMYQRVTEELTLQQSKRDQLLMIYMAAFAFIVPALISEKGISPLLSGWIFVRLGKSNVFYTYIFCSIKSY